MLFKKNHHGTDGNFSAYAINLLAGKAGLNGWRWIFLVEGALTICLGILAWFFVPDFPDKSKWLNHEQRKVCDVYGPLCNYPCSTTFADDSGSS